MEVICPSCGTKYRIRDEKIRGKTVKVTCRKCSSVVYIRDPAMGEPFVFLGRPPDRPQPRKTTKSIPVRKTAKSTKERWYALKKGERIGPFSRQAILEKLKTGEITPKTFMWNPGMQKWRQAGRIEALQDLLDKYHKWEAEQEQERTLITKIPLTPEQDSQEIPPPLPSDQPETDKKNEPSQELQKPLESSKKEVSEVSSVKSLFGTARVPAVPEEDVKKEEPVRHQTIEEISATDLHEIVESHEEKKFFTRAFEAPADLGEHIHEDDDPLVKAAQEPVVPNKETLREFSVLVKLEKKTRKQNIIYGSIGLAVILLVVGLTVFFASRAHVNQHLNLPNHVSGEKFQVHEYTVIKKPKPKKETELVAPPTTPNVVRKNRSVTKRTTKKRKKDKHKPSKTQVAMAKKYKNLLLSATPGEAPVEVKKKTVATMPKIQLNRSGMEKFLRNKTRSLVVCAQRKSYLQGQTVKLVLQFTVANTGKVTAVKLTQPDGMDDPPMFRCIRQKVKSWIFPGDPQRKPLTFKTILFL